MMEVDTLETRSIFPNSNLKPIHIMSVLVGKQAPTFSASAVVNGEVVSDFSLEQYIGKKHVVFFFYPKDFTFVCPTELHAFQDAIAEFEKRDVAVVGCSTDTEMSHWGWLQVERAKGGIAGVQYPLVADTNKQFPQTSMFLWVTTSWTKTANSTLKVN